MGLIIKDRFSNHKNFLPTWADYMTSSTTVSEWNMDHLHIQRKKGEEDQQGNHVNKNDVQCTKRIYAMCLFNLDLLSISMMGLFFFFF